MRVLVAAGSSGGHIFPALEFLDSLRIRSKGPQEALLVLPENSVITGPLSAGCRIHRLPVSPIRLRADFRSVRSLLRFMKGFMQSMALVAKFQPDIVMGFGTLVSIPPVICAWLFRIKTLIHEQNVIPGRANRFLAWFADRIAVSFAETPGYFGSFSGKAALCGNPVRKSLARVDREKALDFFGFRYDKLTILVMGGSMGSRRLNAGFLRALSLSPRVRAAQVIHLSGVADYDFLMDKYPRTGADFRLYKFLEPIGYAYCASDLVISRSGAGTIAELISYRLPAILVPYPYAYKHQSANAKVIEKAGAGLIIEDGQLDTDALARAMESLAAEPERLKRMRACYAGLPAADAASMLVDEAVSLVNN